jgi:hypothetical protein
MAFDSVRSFVTTGLSGIGCTAGPNRFDNLVADLKDVLGPSSGLTSDDVDVQHLSQLMEEYSIDDKGWTRYALGDATRGYTRNLVDEGNGKSNLVSLIPGTRIGATG